MADKVFQSGAGKNNNSTSVSDLADGVRPRAKAQSGSGALVIDWTTSSFQQITLTGNVTLTHSGLIAGKAAVLLLIQDGVGGWSVTSWPTNIKWPSGIAPTMGTTAGKKHLVNLFFDGTDVLGSYADNF